MGETLHVGWNIIFLHQVIPHGASLADVVTDLYHSAHHLKPYKQMEMGGCRLVKEMKTENDVRKNVQAFVITA